MARDFNSGLTGRYKAEKDGHTRIIDTNTGEVIETVTSLNLARKRIAELEAADYRAVRNPTAPTGYKPTPEPECCEGGDYGDYEDYDGDISDSLRHSRRPNHRQDY